MGEREVIVCPVRRVSASTSTVILSSANFHRQGFIVHNDSTDILWIKFGASASVTDFTHQLGPQGSLEHRSGKVYRGLVTGVWAGQNGAAQVTELL